MANSIVSAAEKAIFSSIIDDLHETFARDISIIHEVANTVYHIGSKCYKFETVQLDCPKEGAIEAFQVR